MKFRFLMFVALRYFRSTRRNRRLASPAFSVTGITVGVMTLIAVLAVMNGFQLSFIEPILEVSSYHLQVSTADEGADEEADEEAGALRELAAEVRAVPGVAAVVPFSDMQAIAEGDRSCRIRAVPADAASLDAGFAASFRDELALPDRDRIGAPGTALLGSELAARLGLRVGDTFSLFAFSPESWTELVPRRSTLEVAGLFKTGYYEIDLNWIFVSLETAAGVLGTESLPLRLGVKLDSRRRTDAMGERIRALRPDLRVTTWRETNRLFFTALRTEKALMMLLVGLIFIVVGFNIFHSLRRTVYERREEIGLLQTLGAGPTTIRRVFVLEGFLIGVFGNLLGAILGLLVASNINFVFRAAEDTINGVLLPFAELVLRPFLGDPFMGSVAIFSPRVFYIDRVPSRVLLPETLLVAGFALLCATVAATIASRRVLGYKPIEVMRNV